MPHTRKSPRASRYDYTSSGGYFVTICTKDREHYFGEIIDGNMILNDLGIYTNTEIQRLSERKSVDIHEQIVMPNHIHLLLIMHDFGHKLKTLWNVSHKFSII
jgi:putative transposase